jgi:hypothetical protein
VSERDISYVEFLLLRRREQLFQASSSGDINAHKSV